MDFDKRTKDIVTWLGNEYVNIRTGQASPALLDGIKVESYGAKVSLNQIGSVGIEDARTLRVSPWDVSQVGAIETAIRDADLGMSVSTDSSGLRVIFPELTSERRVQLLKLAKQKLEEARVSVRNARDEIMKSLDKQEKDAEISKDEHFTEKEKIQKQVEATNRELEALYVKKEIDIEK